MSAENSGIQPLRATVRVQFHRDFTLDDAVPLVAYWSRLGISHLYASPLLTARAGSMHGYDVVDPTRINPELGGEPALHRLVAALRREGMGLILDIVSNHMAVGGSSNSWWLDVLEWGRRSPYGQFFDIQWDSPDPLLEGQLLLPFLRSDYGEVLQAGEIPLKLDAASGRFYCEHYEHRFPISPPSYALLLRDSGLAELDELAGRFEQLRRDPDAWHRAGALCTELAQALKREAVQAAIQSVIEAHDSRQPEGLQRLHRLLERQYYRLASWRTAADDINWRRFFDINELGGLRVERPEVFEATHAKIFELIEQGLVDGLRIDHVDGLAEPRGYCRRLRRRVDGLLAQRPAEARIAHLPIFVEKILGAGEQLHEDWGVDGTTGYEFMNQVSLLQHDPAGAEPLAALWSETSGRAADFSAEERQARQQVLNGTLAGDFETVSQLLLQIARSDLMTRDITLGAIRRALMALITHFPVYRVYIAGNGLQQDDQPFFQRALEGARTTLGEADWPLLDYLQRWLGGEPLRQIPPGPQRQLRRLACARFSQLTSPAAAKSVEDTVFYRSAVLLSRNDVGFDADRFSAPPAAFHEACQQRVQSFPDNLLATATHDHKRGEDTRARLAVLSERSHWWRACVQEWFAQAAELRQQLDDGAAPSPGDELMLYQTLVASWPLQLSSDDQDGLREYFERLAGWQQKALREAKLRSAWNAPNAAYEDACRNFLERLLLAPEAARLRDQIAAAARAIAPAGVVNSLAQTLLKMTVPGVPDLYQGCELWDFSLVDPDNRRPVDYPIRGAWVGEAIALPGLLDDWRSGRIKQHLICRTLELRRRHAALFARASYQPLNLQGDAAEHLLAFLREESGHSVIVLVPRLPATLLGDTALPLIPPNRWHDCKLELPAKLHDRAFKGLFSETGVTASQGLLAVSELLGEFPVCVLVCESENSDER
jgi:(1->4)-alpha-D-glucan 1-alpha-D-glucosylmutase